MGNNVLSYKGKVCGECAYLTEKAPIHVSGDIADQEKGLCRLLILHNNFAIMLKGETACPRFIPR